MDHLLKYSGLQAKIIIIREWKRLLIWLVIASSMPLIGARNIISSYPTQENLYDIYTTMQSPVIKLMFGSFDYQLPTTLATEFVAETTMIMLVVVVIMNILLGIFFTRREENNGSAELVQSTAIGKLSSLVAVMIVLTILNVLIGISTFSILEIVNLDGSTWVGNLIVAGMVTTIGLLFQSITMVAAQLASDPTITRYLAFSAFAVLFLIRMYVDIDQLDFQWLSPLSWGGATLPYVDNHSWVLWLGLGIFLVLTILAMLISFNRDFDSGVIHERPGRKSATHFLIGPMTLRLRLSKITIIVWTLVLVVLGIMCGTMYDSIETFADNPYLTQALGSTTGDVILREFLQRFIGLFGMMQAILALVAGMTIMNQIKKDRQSGRIDLTLQTSISRTKVWLSYLICGLVTTWFIFWCGISSIWLGAQMVNITILEYDKYWNLFINLIAPLTLIYAFMPLLISLAERLSSLAYCYVGYLFFVLIFGELVNFPDWADQTTIFSILPTVPIDNFNWSRWLIILAVGVILLIISTKNFNKKDLDN